MFLFLRPCDYLFFRDARPFDAGSESYARSQFPPPPSVLYGAIRTAILANQNISLKDYMHKNYDAIPKELLEVIGTHDSTGKLKLSGPWLAKLSKNTLQEFFPAPYSLMTDGGKYILLKPDEEPTNLLTNLESPLKLIKFDPKYEHEHMLLTCEETIEILKANINQLNKQLKDKDNERYTLYKNMPKVGIKRDPDKRTAEEERLYTINNIHMNPDPNRQYGLSIKITHYDLLPDELITKIGGESRAALAKKVFNSNFCEELNDAVDDITKKILENKLFFIWLITPAIFQNGFIPDFINLDMLEGKIVFNSEWDKTSIDVKLVSCITKSAQPIGGFNIVERFPKPMFKAVPAGSVYFFKIIEDTNNLEEKVKKNGAHSELKYNLLGI